MELEIIKIPSVTGALKATIHSSGKLGFSQAAIDELKISENSYVQIAINKQDKSDNNLYVFITNKEESNTLKINKAGHYYYVSTKPLFDKLEVDYKKNKVIYDIIDIEYEGRKVYKFIRRDKDRKKSK